MSELINEHLEGRSDDIDRFIAWNGSATNRHQITRIVSQKANVASIGHVSPHQLRHTLATQAINRGMSLEAIAAMPGHKTLRMTLVYARIADRTVADAYDNVTDQIDALYNKPAGLKTDGNGSAGMAQLAVDTGVQVYFCDPKSPWQRGSNENTNDLLRQYFPNGTDMTQLTQADLDEAAHSLNGRPRQTLDWMTPSDKLAEALQ